MKEGGIDEHKKPEAREFYLKKIGVMFATVETDLEDGKREHARKVLEDLEIAITDAANAPRDKNVQTPFARSEIENWLRKRHELEVEAYKEKVTLPSSDSSK